MVLLAGARPVGKQEPTTGLARVGKWTLVEHETVGITKW
jgi:hypothetical protein